MGWEKFGLKFDDALLKVCVEDFVGCRGVLNVREVIWLVNFFWGLSTPDVVDTFYELKDIIR